MNVIVAYVIFFALTNYTYNFTTYCIVLSALNYSVNSLKYIYPNKKKQYNSIYDCFKYFMHFCITTFILVTSSIILDMDNKGNIQNDIITALDNINIDAKIIENSLNFTHQDYLDYYKENSKIMKPIDMCIKYYKSNDFCTEAYNIVYKYQYITISSFIMNIQWYGVIIYAITDFYDIIKKY